MESTESSEAHKKAMDGFLVQQKSRMLSLSVSTDDRVVREQLRSLNEPITLFGEDAYSRRERLRLLVARDLLRKETTPGQGTGRLLASIIPPVSKADEASAVKPPSSASQRDATAPSKPSQETFYSEGTEELLEARREIAKASLEKAIHRKKRVEDFRLNISEKQYKAKLEDTSKKITENITFVSSQVADDRPLTEGKFSPTPEPGMKPLLFATASWSGFVRLWRVENLELVQTLVGHEDRVHCVAWRGGVSASLEKCEDGVNGDDYRPFSELEEVEDSEKSSENGEKFDSKGDEPAAKRKKLSNSASHTPPSDDPKTLNTTQPTSSSDVVEIASGCANGTINLYNASRSSPLHVFKDHELRVNKVAFHPLTPHLASSSNDETWRLFDLQKQVELLVQEGHGCCVYSLAFHPDGSLLMSGAQSGDIVGWDLRVGKAVIRYPQAHVKQVLSLSFHPLFSHLFASSSEDHTVKIWDLRKARDAKDSLLGGRGSSSKGAAKRGFSAKNGGVSASGTATESVHTLLAHNKMVTGCVFEPRYGRFLVTGSHDGYFKIWSTSDYSCSCQLSSSESKLMGLDVAFGLVSSVEYDRTWNMWELNSGVVKEWEAYL